MQSMRPSVMAAVLAGAASVGLPQSNPVYVPFSPGAVKGAIYKPDTGPAPQVAVLLMHRTANFMSHIAAKELSQRGFMVLAMNPRSDNNEAAVKWEENALDVKSGMEYLRKQPGIQRVILLGHSGGGPTMSFYQAVAEKGVSYCKGSNKLVECDDHGNAVVRIDGVTGKVKETIPTGRNPAVVAGVDGDVWVSLFDDSQVWRIHPE